VNAAATGLTIHNSIDHTLLPHTGEVNYLLNSESETAGNQSAKEYPLPTEREHQTLRRVVETLPLASFLAMSRGVRRTCIILRGEDRFFKLHPVPIT
jgi:hypothetical protein